MITNFKLFEEINDGEPEVGDYIISNTIAFSDDLRIFIINSIGKIIKCEHFNDGPYKLYCIKYDLPKNFYKNRIMIYRNEIEYWSKDKEDLEDILAAKKFNI